MTTLMEFLTSKEVFVVFLIAVCICVIGTVYFIVEKIYKNRKIVKDNNMEDKIVRISENQVAIAPVLDQIIVPKKEEVGVVVPIVEEQAEKEIVEENITITPIKEIRNNNVEELIQPVETLEVIEPVVLETPELEEELIYTEIEPNKEEAQKQLREATEELLKTQVMQQQENIELTKFEAEQEENAIISMDELMQKSKQLYERNEVTQYEDEGNEPISIVDLEERMNQVKVGQEQLEVVDSCINKEILEVSEEPVTVKLDDFKSVSLQEAYKEDRIFKSSPVISPIFGIEKQQTTTNMELENTANYEKLDEEIKKTNEFLATLKELKKNLD